MTQERSSIEVSQRSATEVTPATYWQRTKSFLGRHKRSLMYGGSILVVTAIAMGAASVLRQVYPDPSGVSLPRNNEFEISYNCVENINPISDGTKHIEVTIKSSSYRTSRDPNDVLIIKWDDGYSNTYRQYDPAIPANPNRVPAWLFTGEVTGSYERDQGYIDFQTRPRGSEANVEVTRGITQNSQTMDLRRVITYQSMRVPRYC